MTGSPQSSYIAGYNPPEAPDLSAHAFAVENNLHRGFAGTGQGDYMQPWRIRTFYGGQFADWQANKTNEYERQKAMYDTAWNGPLNQSRLQSEAGYNNFFSSGNNFGSSIGQSSQSSPLSYSQGPNAIDIAQSAGGALSRTFGLIQGIQQLQLLKEQVRNMQAKTDGQLLNNTYRKIMNDRGLLYNDSFADYLNLRNEGMGYQNSLLQSNIGHTSAATRLLNQDIVNRVHTNIMNGYRLGFGSIPYTAPYAQEVRLGLQGSQLSNESKRLSNIGQSFQNMGLQFYNGPDYLGLVRASLQFDNTLKSLDVRQRASYQRVLDVQTENALHDAVLNNLSWPKLYKDTMAKLKAAGFHRSLDNYGYPIMDLLGRAVGIFQGAAFGTSSLIKANTGRIQGFVNPFTGEVASPEYGWRRY